MAFHTAVWMDNYVDYVSYLTDLDTVSNLNDYTMIEKMDLYPGQTARAD